MKQHDIPKLIKQRQKIDKVLKKHFEPACLDCGVNTVKIKESYMVHDTVWKKAGMKPYGGKLCIGCLEHRLGRKLNCRDFFMIGLNIDAYIYPHRGSKRLKNRLHRLKGGRR